jgi:hypothetical protein
MVMDTALGAQMQLQSYGNKDERGMLIFATYVCLNRGLIALERPDPVLLTQPARMAPKAYAWGLRKYARMPRSEERALLNFPEGTLFNRAGMNGIP